MRAHKIPDTISCVPEILRTSNCISSKNIHHSERTTKNFRNSSQLLAMSKTISKFNLPTFDTIIWINQKHGERFHPIISCRQTGIFSIKSPADKDKQNCGAHQRFWARVWHAEVLKHLRGINYWTGSYNLKLSSMLDSIKKGREKWISI